MTFDFTGGLFNHLLSNPTASPQLCPGTKVAFENQNKILRDVDAYSRDGVSGICSPLSNLFARARMEGQEPKFLTEPSSKKVYNESFKLLNKQMKLDRQGVDGFHVAFHDRDYRIFNIFKEAGKKFGKSSDKEGPAEEMSLLARDANFDNVLDKHNLITYPIKERGMATHQIYFGRDTDTGCTIFNADEKGGVTHGLCADLIASISEVAQRYLRDDGLNKVEIAASSGEKKEVT